MPRFTAATLTFCLLIAAACTGCAYDQQSPEQAVRQTKGYVYYLDGAGGSGMVTNWSRNVRRGFRDAGYAGAGEAYKWQTGFSILVDQASSVSYKRERAQALAADIAQRRHILPNAPITLMGLSAGTAVTVFALEALPAGVYVDNVVLMGSSLSTNYDMTRALAHVRNRMYVFTSEKDAVLKYLVPISGTADRRGRVQTAGLAGFQQPAHWTPQSRTQYAKLSYVQWEPSFSTMGNRGGHTDVVSPRFVREYVAPLVMKAERYQDTIESGSGVPNPDFQRWDSYPVGTWVVFRGREIVDGRPLPLRIRVELVKKFKDKLIIERRYFTGPSLSDEIRVQRFFVDAVIPAENHPFTHPDAHLQNAGRTMHTALRKPVECTVQRVAVNASFPDWGDGMRATFYRSSYLPGGIVGIELKSSRDGRPFGFEGAMDDYFVPKH